MSEGSFEKERELEKDGNNLSITAVVHLLRRGDKAEVLQAADKMNDFLDEVTIGTEDSEMHLVEMHKSNALQTLLSAFTRCTAAAWTECEIPVSRAIAHLVAIEDECDWKLLQQNAREILSALQVLVTQQVSSVMVNEQIRCYQHSLARQSDSYEAALLLSPVQKQAVQECLRLRDIIAKAIFKLCFVLSKHWSQSSLQSQSNSRPPSIDLSENVGGSLSYRELRRNRGQSKVVSDIGQLLGLIAHIIAMLIGDESNTRAPDTQNVIDETTVLCASAMLSLSKVPQGRQSFLTHGSMSLVTRWLEEAKFILADAFEKSITLPDDHLVFKLVNNICGILVSVATSTIQAGEHDYSIGWADSQIIAMSIPSTIVKVINSSIRYEKSFTSIIESSVILFDYKALSAFTEVLLSLSSRSHNRPQLSDAKVPIALCVLILSTLSMLNKDFPIVIATGGHSKQQTSPFRLDAIGKQKIESLLLQAQAVTRDALQHIVSIVASCLNALSYYLDDEMTGVSATNVTTPALVEILCNKHMIACLSYTLTRLSANNSREARLACLRVVACLSEWPASIDAMMQSDIAAELIKTCREDTDAVHSENSFQILKPPGPIDRQTSLGSSILSFPMRTTFDDDTENLIIAVYALANICQSSLVYTEKLSKQDLLSLMLDQTTSGIVDVERQSMRCICSMCQVIAKEVKTFDPLVFDKVLSKLVVAVRSPNPLMQLEAVRGIAYLANANDKIKTAVVEELLKTIVKLMIDPDSDIALKLAAESVMKNLGFTNGVKDLELCQYDFSLLKEWYNIRSWVITQLHGAVLLNEWMVDLFDGNTNQDIFVPFSNSGHRIRSNTSLGGMQPPKLTLTRSFTDGLKSIFAFPQSKSHHDLSLGIEKSIASSNAHDDGLKDLIVSSVMLKRASSNTSNHSVGGMMIPAPTTDSGSPERSHHLDTESERPRQGVLDLYCTLFPSRIHRELILGLSGLGMKDKNGLLRMPRVQEVNTVLLPGRAYTSFNKIGRIIERMIEDSSRRWAICFNESTFFGDFYTTLLEHVRKSPKLCSIHISCPSPQPDARLGYMAGTLPGNIQFLSFSNALSTDSIENLCICLHKNNTTFSNAVDDYLIQPLVEDVMVGLLGLSITNQTLDSKSVSSICTLLIPHEMEIIDPESEGNDEFDFNFPAIPACRGLKHLDLSNNRLSDAVCAEIIKAVCASTLESLDLGYNLIQKGILTKEALERNINCSQLRHLGLAHNELSKKILSGFLDVIRVNHTLSSIDFSHNDFKRSSKEYIHDSLRVFLRENTCVRQIDFSNNNFDDKTVKALQVGMLSNETVLIMLLAGNPNALASKNYELVLDKLKLNRAKYKEQVASKSNFDLLSMTNNTDMFQITPIDQYMQQVSQPSPLLSSQRLMEEQLIFDSIVSENDSVSASLTVLFSAPLAWRDRLNKLYPVEALDLDAERDLILQVFREVRRDISLTFDFATTDRLRTALSLGCRALHFSGHGHPSCLIFEDGQSGLQNISVDMLTNLLRAGGLTLDFVFVSACHSRNTGVAFAEAGVPHVVCVKVDAKLLDSAAMVFTRAFYLSLLSGHAVRESFDIAREALKSSPYVVDSDVEGEKFLLLPELDPHDVPLFKCPQVPRWPGLAHHTKAFSSANIDLSLLPSPPPDFEGREVDMFRVISTLKDRRLVSVVADSGFGKSALVAAVSRYMSERGMFSEGIMFVRLQGVNTHLQFLQAVRNALSRGPPKLAIKISSSRNVGADDSSWSVNELEESLVKCLGSLEGKVLIVLDHADEMLSVGDTAEDLKYFLQKVFERCDGVRILVAYCSSDTTIRRMDTVGVVEHCVTLGSLSLVSTLRLFARLSPCLPSSETKHSFVTSLLPAKQAHSTFTSKDLTPTASQLFCLFGKGHPATIVKMACEATIDSVTQLQAEGRDIIAGKKPRRSISNSRTNSKDQDEQQDGDWIKI